jgi:hypothetical protein
MMEQPNRRDFLVASAAVAVSAATLGVVGRAVAGQVVAGADGAGGDGGVGDGLGVRWLEGVPGFALGTTFGVPHARGAVSVDRLPGLVGAGGQAVVAGVEVLGYWPDGSVKWTSVTVPPGSAAAGYRLGGDVVAPAVAVTVEEGADEIRVGTGAITAVIGRSGAEVLRSVSRDGKEILRGGRLVALWQGEASPDAEGTAERKGTESRIEAVLVEKKSAVRAVVKVSGKHAAEGGKSWLPFDVRFYFMAGSDVVRVVHTFVYDGDENKDFIAGLGVRFGVVMRDEMYDRHIRLSGAGGGLFAEAVRPVTGLRRDPGKAVREAQVAGLGLPPREQWDRRVTDRLELIPTWGDFTLSQQTADGFNIRKRTKPGCGWIHAAAGGRSDGAGFVGGASGGVGFAVRDFWKKPPAQIDIRNAAVESGGAAEITMWLYSPLAPAMDNRFYHDGLGMDTYPKQIEGLNITYEDYEPGYGTPTGIARTSEMFLWVAAATPSKERLAAFAQAAAKPAVLAVQPRRYLDAGVFGGIWTLPDRSTPVKAAIEKNLDYLLDGYVKEVDQRKWYGFWDYGDVMHTYDSDRHQWRYDIGGYAWDNSELSPDLWLWMSYLRNGRADVYRLAEAMTRHTGEVDVYHLGRFKYLGTRHGVQHWSCSSKQTRISTAIYRRHFYFLSGGDERVGDLLKEQLLAIESEKKIVVGRKLGENAQVLPLPPLEDPPRGGDVRLGAMGYGNNVAAWLAEAERTGDAAWHDKIVTSMRGIGELPYGFLAGGWTVNADTGEIKDDGTGVPDASGHLTTMFGLPEIAAELVSLYGEKAPKFAPAWGQYGRLYGGTAEERTKEVGRTWRTPGFMDTNAKCTGFAAKMMDDKALKDRAWRELLGERGALGREAWQTITRVNPPEVLEPIDERQLGTNGAAQWSLSAIQVLHYAGDAVPEK